MWWVIWALLLVVSGAYLSARMWGLWGQTKELGSELAIAQERLDNVQGQMELLGERIGTAEELSVFASPAAASAQRERAKADGRRARRQRLDTTRLARAKHVD
jgi:hypothetical protein